MKKKPSVEKELRTREMVQFLITKHQHYNETIRFFSARWGVTTRTVDAYISRAKEIILDTSKQDREYIKAECLSQINNIVMKAGDNKNYYLALQAIQKKIDLLGLAEPKRIEVKNEGEQNHIFNFGEKENSD